MLRLKNVDSEAEFRRFLPAMALIAPYLPPNPHRPRAFGGKGAEGMKKGIPISQWDEKGNSYQS
jgi:hypothetical protein